MLRSTCLVLAMGLLAATAGWAEETSRVLGSISIGAGEHAGDLSTVNGSIHIGSGAVIGSAHTVNGGITLQDHASATELRTVNGGVHLEDGARVSGGVHTVNGSLHLSEGADVAGQLHNVNGAIEVVGAHVGGGIDTVNGGMEIGPNAHIDGGITVRRNEGEHNYGDIPRVIIAPGSVVNGTMRFEQPVKLFVSERATIGPVEGATVQKFSGDRPTE